MSKIEIKKNSGLWSVRVNDGPNLAANIVAGGVYVDLRDNGPHRPLVRLTLVADDLAIDFDDAEVDKAVAHV